MRSYLGLLLLVTGLGLISCAPIPVQPSYTDGTNVVPSSPEVQPSGDGALDFSLPPR